MLRRTVEYCATAAIIQVAFVLSAADMTLTDIIFIFVLNVGTQLVGYIIDDRKDMVSDGLNFVVGFLLLTGQLVYVYMLSTQVRFTKTLEEDKFFITFASIFFVIFYVSFGLLKLLCYVNNIRKVVEDQLYVVLSVSAKLSLTWILIGNILLDITDCVTVLKQEITLVKMKYVPTYQKMVFTDQVGKGYK